jgi:hypothetical protein
VPNDANCPDDGLFCTGPETCDPALDCVGDPPCVAGEICNEALDQCEPGAVEIVLQPIASGLAAPIDLTHAGDGSGRLFVADQAGQIRIIDASGNLLPTPFLDISAKLPVLGTIFDERGLLGLAFHPDYESNGRFFVRYSAPREGLPEEPCNDPGGFIVGCHKEVLAEYAVSADPNSSTTTRVPCSSDRTACCTTRWETAAGPTTVSPTCLHRTDRTATGRICKRFSEKFCASTSTRRLIRA